MRFASLGSGSKGNATVITHRSTSIMVDCGFSVREVERRMARLETSPAQLDALLVTHEHGDHIRGVGALARKYQIPVYMTHGTQRQSDMGVIPSLVEFDCHEAFSLGELDISPFPVPHDAREPCQFVFHGGVRNLGLLTDTGSITAHIREHLSNCHALILECNHELEWLWDGDYPPSLKARVAGELGHLCNAQAVELLQTIETTGLKHLAAAHLSEKHNTPGRVKQVLSESLGCEQEWINVIDQAQGLGWREL